MGLKDEFKKFVFRGNVVDLAVAVIIGGAFGKIVSAFVDDLVMPALNPIMPGKTWEQFAPGGFKIGHFAGTVLDFLIVAFVIFLVLVKFVGVLMQKPAPVAAPPTKSCTECLETVPLAAKRCKFCTSVLGALALFFVMAGSAQAQDVSVPKFEYGKAEEVKVVEWKAQVKGGITNTAGNSQATNGSISGQASRKAGDNKFALDVGAAYGTSKNRKFIPTNGGDPALVDSDADVTREKVTSTNNWNTRGRYDRFLTENNAAYVLGNVGADKVAGKKLFGGGQVGYSRQLLKDEAHLVLAEVGYDFTYESYSAANSDAVSVHSARVFLGETWKLSDATGIFGSAEALFNLNEESKALVANTRVSPKAGVGSFKDTRINAKAGLTTTLWKNLSFGFGVTLRYDQNPAPLAVPNLPMDKSFVVFANKVDVITEASLIVTLL